MNDKIPKSIDDYIVSAPKEVQGKLREIRQAIHETAPEAEETISYRMPAFRMGGVLVYFAAFKDHIGFFPTSSGVWAFKDKLASYKTSKGTVQFPLDKPLPIDLIKEIVAFRVKENIAKKPK